MSAQLKTAECLLCGPRTGNEPLLGGSLCRCLTCGFTWTNAIDESTRDLYNDSYFVDGGYQDYFAHVDQWRYEAGRRLSWLLSGVRPRTLLEAGSAGGFFVEAARSAGIDASGVEPTRACVRYSRERLKVPVQHGYFESTAVKPVDAVCGFHVLEHVDDPRKFLATARSQLVPSGWIALEVPNIDSSAARRQGTSWPHLYLKHHRWHFSPQSLTRLVESCGFIVRRCDTIFTRYYTRPLRRLRPSALAKLAADYRAVKSLRMSDPQCGDLLRVIAQLPESSMSAYA
ncbi:class I SAM-dependent methyltransferase [Streptomyces mirabilis]|uniref:class I SAM-dependent methyltransferase n=1 Tax=Streptomyces mirabilis TaxID=68239 RepID=UPI00367E4EF8